MGASESQAWHEVELAGSLRTTFADAKAKTRRTRREATPGHVEVIVSSDRCASEERYGAVLEDMAPFGIWSLGRPLVRDRAVMSVGAEH
jgi:hypothetical protein